MHGTRGDATRAVGRTPKTSRLASASLTPPADHGDASRNAHHERKQPMSISLSDIPQAVADYVKNSVNVEVSEVKHGISNVLQPHEKGTFTVTVTNNGTVRLTDLVYELSVSPGSVAELISPEGTAIFALDGIGGSPIPNGKEVDKLFLTAISAISWASVDGGASVTTTDLQVKTQSTLGTATIKCILHANVDQASLFPTEQEGTAAKRTLTVS
jgi:hypothetical protein